MASFGVTATDGLGARTSASDRKACDLPKFRLPFAEWRRRWRFRADLKRLVKVGPHMIADIGLTPDEALHESAKPFWRA